MLKLRAKSSVIAPSVDDDARAILAAKANMRVVVPDGTLAPSHPRTLAPENHPSNLRTLREPTLEPSHPRTLAPAYP